MIDVNTNHGQADDNARQVIRRTKQVTRRKFSPEEKVRIVIEGIRGEITVSALCRREGIVANVYYKWLKDFMEAGKGRLKGDSVREASRFEVQSLHRENERLKELLAQLSVENLVLKKPRLEPMGQPYVRREAQVKAEVLQLVVGSPLPVRQTLKQLQIAPTTYHRTSATATELPQP